LPWMPARIPRRHPAKIAAPAAPTRASALRRPRATRSCARRSKCSRATAETVAASSRSRRLRTPTTG
jgi:hypothetical protein